MAPISSKILEHIFEHVMFMRDPCGEVLGSLLQSTSKEDNENKFLKKVKAFSFSECNVLSVGFGKISFVCSGNRSKMSKTDSASVILFRELTNNLVG